MSRDCLTPSEAETYYADLQAPLEPEIVPRFLSLAEIGSKWLPRVFAYFEHPYTTGYIEAINRGLDDMQRAGRGSSFELLRAQLMLSEKLQK